MRDMVTAILMSSKLELLEKISGNNFLSSYAEANTSGPLNSEIITDVSFLRTVLATRKSCEDPGPE